MNSFSSASKTLKKKSSDFNLTYLKILIFKKGLCKILCFTEIFDKSVYKTYDDYGDDAFTVDILLKKDIKTQTRYRVVLNLCPWFCKCFFSLEDNPHQNSKGK